MPPKIQVVKQEGPKGPGSLTWKGQRSQWSHLQRTTNVVHQIQQIKAVLDFYRKIFKMSLYFYI